MKKTATIIMALALLFSLAGCAGKSETDGKLTMDIVRNIVQEKGDEMTWSDFEQYDSTETGSGLLILVYDINENYQLWIGGTPGEKPIYFKLCLTDDIDNSIDIRYDNIDEFLERTK